MAKISARGDREVVRAKNANGGVMLLTEQGRVLRKLTAASGYNLMGRVKGSAAEQRKRFDKMARERGYEAA